METDLKKTSKTDWINHSDQFCKLDQQIQSKYPTQKKKKFVHELDIATSLINMPSRASQDFTA